LAYVGQNVRENFKSFNVYVGTYPSYLGNFAPTYIATRCVVQFLEKSM